MNNNEFVTRLQGKSVREFAARLSPGTWKIEAESLNRYRVYESRDNHGLQPVLLIDRRSFVLLDKELYRLQSRENPLAFAIEKALDNDVLEFCISKSSIDKMPVKLLCKTLSSAKVTLEGVLLKADNYIIRVALVPAVSERDLTQKELEIAELFIKANEAINFGAGNQVTPETPALPMPETAAAAVDTTAKEVIPAK